MSKFVARYQAAIGAAVVIIGLGVVAYVPPNGSIYVIAPVVNTALLILLTATVVSGVLQQHREMQRYFHRLHDAHLTLLRVQSLLETRPCLMSLSEPEIQARMQKVLEMKREQIYAR